MRVLNLNCNECGAPLVVPRKTNYVTCEFCGTQLEVVRDDGAAYTRINELEERTDRLEVDVARLKASDEIDRLDREWEREMKTYEVRNKDGEASIPTVAGSTFAASLAAVFGVFWTVMAGSAGGPLFALIGVVLVVAAIAGGINGVNKAQQYERRRRRYERERREIVSRLDDS